MSAIVAAASARSWHVKILRQVGRTIGGPTGAHMLASADYHEQRLAAAGRAIADASNAAGAGRVVEGAPRTSRVQWAGPGTTGEWTAWTTDGAATRRPALRRTVDGVRQPDVAPTWDGERWLWGTWGHDPRPCAWPRPLARGADR